MQYGFKVVYPDAKEIAAMGFAKVANLPFIFDGEPGYARLPNRFLIDRGLGYWDPKWRGARRNAKRPTRKSMKNYADRLTNALEWAEVRGIDLMTADYTDILINRYQREMLLGIWSANNNPLSPETVNARVQIALEYQMWVADTGLREAFIVPTMTRMYVAGSHASSNSHEARTVESRKGKVKVQIRALALPNEEQLKAWRQRIQEMPVVGKTQGLIADLILATAIRREEAACWRTDTLPLEPKEWQIANPDQPEEFQNVIVTIKYGTKGDEYAVDEYGDKLGPAGTIHVPLCLAHRIHEYRRNERLLALKPALRQARSKDAYGRILAETVHLFINPTTGKRYSGDQIYRFWTTVERPAHWSPHAARHWWACTYLWERMKQHAELLKRVVNIPNLRDDHPLVLALRDTAQTVIQLEIKPQLRHVSTATTELYLRWLFAQLRIPVNLTHHWMEMMEADDSGEVKNA